MASSAVKINKKLSSFETIEKEQKLTFGQKNCELQSENDRLVCWSLTHSSSHYSTII